MRFFSSAFINAAFIDGVHDNQRAAALIVKKKIEDRDKAVEIYLTEEELQALYEMRAGRIVVTANLARPTLYVIDKLNKKRPDKTVLLI